MFQPKDAVPQDQRNNIVYKIPCKDCDATYIGESKRSFKVRSSEHIRAVQNMEVDRSEIADHCWNCNHEMNWNEKKVIDTEPYVWSRKIKETIHSISDTNHTNSISYNLPEIWHPNLQTKAGMISTLCLALGQLIILIVSLNFQCILG